MGGGVSHFGHAANRNTANTKEQRKIKHKSYPSISHNYNKNKAGVTTLTL